jgi:hypothetical protein
MLPPLLVILRGVEICLLMILLGDLRKVSDYCFSAHGTSPFAEDPRPGLMYKNKCNLWHRHFFASQRLSSRAWSTDLCAAAATGLEKLTG